MLLLEVREESAIDDGISSDSATENSQNTFYILFLPVLDGEFRSSLQGTPANELQFCVESGWCNFLLDPHTTLHNQNQILFLCTLIEL